LSASFPISPPLIQFFGLVDTAKYILAENDEIGLDTVTRNSSAIFLTWSKFPELENGTKPVAGWYPNYVYAMLPKTKPHLTKKCEGYDEATTPFRKHGRKAYIRGYMHGFCNKTTMFDSGACPNLLEFVPFVEIIDIDWAFFSNDKASSLDVPATPSKRTTQVDGLSSERKRKIVFDPFESLDTGSTSFPSTQAGNTGGK
jgi:hypothetical protein